MKAALLPLALLLAACAPAPQGPGEILFRAVGNEPGWALTVDRQRIDYVGDYGETRISEPTPPGFEPRAGSWSSGRLAVTIAPGPCSDGMSDLVYRLTVRVDAAGKAVSGCGGGTVPSSTLAGSNWSVIAINGRPTPRGDNYFIRFEESRLSAQFGCNGMGGAYSLNGDHLSVPSLEQTLIGCPEPAMRFESEGAAVLRSNVRVERPDGRRMRLVSEAGSIDLELAI
jgi:uncharacterized membrane protein